MNDAQLAREKGVKKVSGHYKWWVDPAVLEIAKLARQKAIITADDIRHLNAPHPNCIGAAFRIAFKQGYIKLVGYSHSGVTSTHSRIVRQWSSAMD